MNKFIYLLTAVLVFVISSCSNPNSRYNKEMDQAERLIPEDTDSALCILGGIDPSELTVDSLRAKYHFLKGYGHFSSNRSMNGDSLIGLAHQYYQGRNKLKDVRSGIVYAWYKFWVGETSGALSMLDSLAMLPDVPDSVMVQVLEARVLLGTLEYQGESLIPFAKRLYGLETDTLKKLEAKYMLLSGYEYANDIDSALCIIDELIDCARNNKWGNKQFVFEVERAQLLTEAGRNAESEELIGEIFRKAGPDNGAKDYLHLQYAINALNIGELRRAAKHLELADSLAIELRNEDDSYSYFRNYSNLLHAIIDFKQTGRLKLMNTNRVNNRHIERLNRVKASQWESERDALHQQNRALALKAESEHKTVVILIISVVALLIIALSSWLIIIRRQRERENEERIEALQKMVDEYNSASAIPESKIKDSSALRSVMLKQLGIIKMVAETPTEQNREMLRKISSIDGEIDNELVNWGSVFGMIDNLYSGFYEKLHGKYGNVLNQKEERIIVLMVAGFSTKEISVITGQTASTVYVRKTSIRKKLGVPEKEDIVRFLQS